MDVDHCNHCNHKSNRKSSNSSHRFFKTNRMLCKLCFGGSLMLMILILCLGLVAFVIGSNDNDNDLVKNEIRDEINNLTVRLPELGIIQGSITQTAWTKQIIYQFLGIPFAESPRKHLRFKPPIPRKPWTDIKQTVNHGRQCPNTHYLINLSPEELNDDLEDCLNIAVYTKNMNSNSPVMVYIHGGGFYNGSALDHPPNYLLEEDIVLVVPEYRLGIFGFISTQSDEIPGNVAVLDLILALQWVQKYIKLFGGDPTQVTIFGQSAGAALVNVLMYSTEVPYGLFNRAIIQSGTFLAKWAYNENPIPLAKQACLKLNCSTCIDVKNINQCLMEMPTYKLLMAVAEENNNGVYGLTIGDKNNILPIIPLELMKRTTKKYPLIGGVTKHEGTFILGLVYDILKAKYLDVSHLNSHDIIDVIIKLSRENDDSGVLGSLTKKLLFSHSQLTNRNFTELIPGLIDLSSILMLKASVLRLIQLHSKLNPSSTYLYTFDYQGQYTRFGYEAGNEHYPFNGGVHHSDDNLYIFPKYKLNEKDEKISKKMVKLWTSFARNGIPQFDDDSEPFKWKSVTEETGPYLHINEILSSDEDFLDEYLVTVKDPSNQIIRRRRRLRV